VTRSNYSDDGDYSTAGLYRHAVNRGIKGPRGQVLLREMIVALDALPVRELAADVFVSGDYVCAMGAVARARGIDSEALAKLDEYDPDDVGALLDIPPSLAAEIAYENDEWCRGDDEDRWEYMRKWAASNIIERKPTQTGTCPWCCKTFTIKRGVVNRHKYNGARCPGAGKPSGAPGGAA